MKKPNLSKIGEFVKSNKAGIVGIIGLGIAEIGFMCQGFKDGIDDGVNIGADYVLNKAKDLDDGTFDKLKNEMTKDGCTFYD